MAKNKNIYKPRYKIAFQAKSKIWPYKNSRLRRFFSIRGRWPQRCGSFRKNILVASTIKWTVARRSIRAYSVRIYPQKSKTRYKNAFYTKQQVRHFYGKITEVKLRSFYKTHLIDTVNRNKSFFGALECRADMFLFRLRLLPTIYACHQYVHHHGLIISKHGLEKSPHALIKVGTTISIPKKHWRTLYKYLLYRVFYRAYGKTILKKRQYKILKKKSKWLHYWKKRFKRKLKKTKLRLRRWNMRRRRFNRYFTPKPIRFSFTYFKKKRKKILKRKCILQKARNAKGKISNRKYKKLKKKNEEYQFKIFHYKLVREIYGCWHDIMQNVIPTVRELILNPENKHVLRMSVDIYAGITVFLQFFLSFKAKFVRFWQNINKYLYFSSRLHSRRIWTPRKKKYLKRRPRLLILILSFIYVVKMQWIDVYEDYNYKRYKLAAYYVNKALKKQDIEFQIQTPESYGFQTYMIEDPKHVKYLQILREEQALSKENFTLIFRVWTRKLFRKINPRKIFASYQKKRSKYSAHGTQLLYFLINRRYKKIRKTKIQRLKKIHWYIPNYIYFDLKTLQAMLLYSPRSKELVFPFKCSLLKIFSFYKSLGV